MPKRTTHGYVKSAFGPGKIPTTAEETEALDLGASEIACAVADAFALLEKRHGRAELACELDPQDFACVRAFRRLEAATRGSAMRKVRP